jgi:hypothetical protein
MFEYFASGTSNTSPTLQSLYYVIPGGLMGGLLQPIVSKLNPRTGDPEISSYILGPLLGLAAAGITVYVLAKTQTGDVLHLLFFSLLCGMAFPAILTNAVDQIGKRTREAEKRTVRAADKVKNALAENKAEAATELKSVLVKNPADEISAAGKIAVGAAAGEALRNMAESAASSTPAQAKEMVEQLREVASIAQTAGYTDTANVAADALQKLSTAEDIADKTVRKMAGDAADRIKSAN